MTTIINTPPSDGGAESGLGIILGVIVGLILIALFFVYALPALRGTPPPKGDSTNINVTLPSGTNPTPTP